MASFSSFALGTSILSFVPMGSVDHTNIQIMPFLYCILGNSTFMTLNFLTCKIGAMLCTQTVIASIMDDWMQTAYS